MTQVRANVVCNWFDGSTFNHNIPQAVEPFHVQRNKSWSGNCFNHIEGDMEVSLFFNDKTLLDYDFVIDLGVTYSDISAMVPPDHRILALTEPSIWMDLSPENIEKVSSFYKGAILCWHDKLISLPQSRFWNPTDKWVEEGLSDKIFGVSGTVSNKIHEAADGYRLRYNILLNQHLIKIPSMVWNFTKLWNGEEVQYPLPKKDVSMKYMFGLAIENVRENGYFTEKLIDCFATYTVPLYFGAPNISDFFDMDGIIVLDQYNWMDQINSLTKDDFKKRKQAMDINYENSKKYWSTMAGLSKMVMYLYKITKACPKE